MKEATLFKVGDVVVFRTDPHRDEFVVREVLDKRAHVAGFVPGEYTREYVSRMPHVAELRLVVSKESKQ